MSYNSNINTCHERFYNIKMDLAVTTLKTIFLLLKMCEYQNPNSKTSMFDPN